jgi:CxxC-x17-CxxC domain-containing protein
MSQQVRTEIKCSDCGKTATVPFKPTAGKPVYCRECLAKHRGNGAPRKSAGTTKHEVDGEENMAWSRRRNDWK